MYEYKINTLEFLMFSERLLETSFGNLVILFVRMLVDSYVITVSVYKRFCLVNVGERRLKGNAAADCRTLQHRHPHHSRDLFPWLPYSQSCITQCVGLLCILKPNRMFLTLLSFCFSENFCCILQGS